VLNKAITYPYISLTWDTGHDAVSNFSDKEYLMRHTGSIAHMHFHDAKGESDHQIPYDGELNIPEIISFAKEKNLRMLIEVKTADALRKSVKVLRERNLI
jgi:sugar phosphate isomerase/epimerase